VAAFIRRSVAEQFARTDPQMVMPKALPCAKCSDRTKSLTVTEMQILKMLCDGRTTSEISRIRSRSQKTLQHHVISIRRKLGARTPTHLGFLAALKFGVDHAACVGVGEKE
jgi:DNA-binding CsgD family transcriptional regulator